MALSSAAAPRSRSPDATCAVPRLNCRAGVGLMAFAFSNDGVDFAYSFAWNCFTPRPFARYAFRSCQTRATSIAMIRRAIIPHLDVECGGHAAAPTAPARPAHSRSFRASIRQRAEHQQREGGAE